MQATIPPPATIKFNYNSTSLVKQHLQFNWQAFPGESQIYTWIPFKIFFPTNAFSFFGFVDLSQKKLSIWSYKLT